MSFVGVIKLSADEQALVDAIIWDPGARHRDGHAAYLSNAPIVPRLIDLLVARNAIPAHRLAYFSDPAFAPTRGRAPQQVFERNGTRGREIFEHPNFLPYLRYFLGGPELPELVVQSYRTAVEAEAPITSDDVHDLSQSAKDLVRRHHLLPSEAAEEFYKLSLDCGVHVMHARHVRDVVRRMKPPARRGG